MIMRKNKIWTATLTVLLVLSLAGCSSAESGGDQPTGVEHTIEFYAEDCEGNAAEQMTDRIDLVTKQAKLIHTASGEEYKLRIATSNEGAVRYTFETAEENVDLSQFQVITPAQYIEKEVAETIRIPLSGDSEYFIVTVSNREGQGLEVEFAAKQMDILPYEMVLVVDGEVYEDLGMEYRFDNATGDLKEGSFFISSLSTKSITEDAYLETDRVLERYELTGFSMIN